MPFQFPKLPIGFATKLGAIFAALTTLAGAYSALADEPSVQTASLFIGAAIAVYSVVTGRSAQNAAAIQQVAARPGLTAPTEGTYAGGPRQ